MHHIAFLKLFCWTIQGQLLEARQLLVNGDYAVAAMVAFANGDALGIQEDECCVKGGEAGGVGESGAFEQGPEDCF